MTNILTAAFIVSVPVFLSLCLGSMIIANYQGTHLLNSEIALGIYAIGIIIGIIIIFIVTELEKWYLKNDLKTEPVILSKKMKKIQIIAVSILLLIIAGCIYMIHTDAHVFGVGLKVIYLIGYICGALSLMLTFKFQHSLRSFEYYNRKQEK